MINDIVKRQIEILKIVIKSTTLKYNNYRKLFQTQIFLDMFYKIIILSIKFDINKWLTNIKYP